MANSESDKEKLKEEFYERFGYGAIGKNDFEMEEEQLASIINDKVDDIWVWVAEKLEEAEIRGREELKKEIASIPSTTVSEQRYDKRYLSESSLPKLYQQTKSCMYCPEHNVEYAQDGDPFANSICGQCGCRKSTHYRRSS